jgi:hypothetical protein
MNSETPTIRFTSRFPLSCAWAVPVVVCRPAGERHIQDVAWFKALIGIASDSADFLRG